MLSINNTSEQAQWARVRGLESPEAGSLFTHIDGLVKIANLSEATGFSPGEVIKILEGMAARGFLEVEFFTLPRLMKLRGEHAFNEREVSK